MHTRRIPPDYPEDPPRRRAGPILVGLFILVLLLTVAVLFGMVLASRSSTAAPTTVVITPSSAPTTTTGPALPTETEFPTPSTTPAEQATPSSVAPGIAAPSNSKPQWQGQVRVTGDGIDLDPIPPSKGGTYDFSYSANSNAFSFYYVMSPWTGAGDPTYEDCRNLTSTQALSSSEAQDVRYQEGASYCAWTSSDKLTFIRPIPPVSGDGIQVKVTVW